MHIRGQRVVSYGNKVEIEHNGENVTLDVPEGENILSVALDEGMDLPHDCKLGVCMNCAARLISGEVDQSAGMLRDDVQEKGCVEVYKGWKILGIVEDLSHLLMCFCWLLQIHAALYRYSSGRCVRKGH